MQETRKQQPIPVKVYRTGERVMVAAPMAGLEPEDIVVDVTADGRLVLHGDLRGLLKEVKELLLDEWSVGAYHRELMLPVPVNHMCQRHLRQWRAAGDLAPKLADAPGPPRTRTTHANAWRAQRQCGAPSHLRDMMARGHPAACERSVYGWQRVLLHALSGILCRCLKHS